MTNVYFAHFTQNCGLKLLGQLVVGACLFLTFLSSSLDERLSTVPAISLRTRSLFDRPFVGVGASEKTTATTTMSPVLSAWIEIREREVERTEISRSGEWNAYWISRKWGEGMSMAAHIYLVSPLWPRMLTALAPETEYRRGDRNDDGKRVQLLLLRESRISWLGIIIARRTHKESVPRRRIEAGFNPIALSLTSLIVAYTEILLKYPKIWMAAELKIILLDYQNF